MARRHRRKNERGLATCVHLYACTLYRGTSKSLARLDKEKVIERGKSLLLQCEEQYTQHELRTL